MAAAAVALMLAGCSSTSGIPYPSLPRLPGATTDSTETMSPEEQKGAIDDLTNAQAANSAAARSRAKETVPQPAGQATPPLEEPVEAAPLPE
jgi:hypothetical protein